MNLERERTAVAPKVAQQKIAFVITGLSTGGAEMMLYKFLTRIDRERYAPVVISMMDGGVFVERFEALDIPVKTLGLKPAQYNFGAVFKLAKILREIQPDLIQGWMYHANLFAQWAKYLAKSKAPVFWSIHHSVDSLRAERLVVIAVIKVSSWFSGRAEKVVFSATKGQNQHTKLGFAANNALAIGDNFDLTKYKPVSNSGFNLRSALNLPEDAILVGSVARYHPMKDHATLLDAAAILIEQNPLVHFVLIGPDVVAENPALAEQIERLGISDRVHLLGERQDVPDLMTSFDVFTTSSARGESFPNVLGEAMSCQVPCVATDIGDSRIIVGDTGVVVEPKDPQALANAWHQLVKLDRTERQELGKQARQRIEANFNLDGANSFVRKYEAMYEAFLAQNCSCSN